MMADLNQKERRGRSFSWIQLIEIVGGGLVGGGFAVGMAYATLKADVKAVERSVTVVEEKVAVVKSDLASHEILNKEYRERTAFQRESDRKEAIEARKEILDELRIIKVCLMNDSCGRQRVSR
jgi:hypothetical protein